MDIASQQWLDKCNCWSFAAVLAERGQHLVRSVPERGYKAADHDRIPRSRALPCHRPHVQHGRVRRRLQVPRRLAHEPQQQVQSVVVPPRTTVRLSKTSMHIHVEHTPRLPDELLGPDTRHHEYSKKKKIYKFLYLNLETFVK